MKKHKQWLTLMILIIGLSSGCSLIDGQLDEANKLVAESDAANPKFNELFTKSNDLFNDLMGDNWVKAKDTQAYKEQNKSKFDELISLREQVEKIGDEQTGKLEKASDLSYSLNSLDIFKFDAFSNLPVCSSPIFSTCSLRLINSSNFDLFCSLYA